MCWVWFIVWCLISFSVSFSISEHIIHMVLFPAISQTRGISLWNSSILRYSVGMISLQGIWWILHCFNSSKSRQPFVLFGSHSAKEDLENYCFTFPSEGHHIRNTGPAGSVAKHMVRERHTAAWWLRPHMNSFPSFLYFYTYNNLMSCYLSHSCCSVWLPKGH